MDSTPLTLVEPDTLTDPAYRSALAALFATHALVVWGWGQRGVYEALLMDGPTLNTHVLTAGMWAEQERNLWQWERLIARVVDTDPDACVADAMGESAAVVGHVATWLDLMTFAAAVNTLGAALAGTLRGSTYGPLRRHAVDIRRSNHAMAADAVSALRDAIGAQAVDRGALNSAADHSRSDAIALLDRVEAREPEWLGIGAATPVDRMPIIAAIDAALSAATPSREP